MSEAAIGRSCRFDTVKGRKSGVVRKMNKKTVLIRTSTGDKLIKRGINKHHVVIYGPKIFWSD